MKRDFAVIIPAQESNQYHEKGDLAPFGNTTLLEWKIAQCKEFTKEEQIYICANSFNIKQIAIDYKVNFIQRAEDENYTSVIFDALNQISSEDIILTHCTSPFINKNIYSQMYSTFIEKELNFLVATRKIKEYAYYQNYLLEYPAKCFTREQLEPIYIITNGCFIFNKSQALKEKNFIPNKAKIFEIGQFASLEIKDINDYVLARELISIYFEKDIS